MTLLLWTLVIAILTAVACSLCGVMLVVKREAFIAEGLSHAVLPGIIFAFLIFQDRSSPWLILAAGLSGLVMVWLVQLVVATRRVYVDAALGIVFSAMFSVGVLASSLRLKNVHFDAHCIIDGNLAFAPLNRFLVGGVDLGPKAFIVMLFCLVVLTAFLLLFFKELKLMLFDASAAKLLGYRPKVLHTVWLALVSITAVAAFETAGTILVVAMMIAPAAAANLLTNRLSAMFWISGLLATIGAAIGIGLSYPMNISPAGPIASTIGLIFLGVVVFAPKQGLLSKHRTRKHQRRVLLQALADEVRSSQLSG